MAGFKIQQCDPDQFRQEILTFWEKYLPGTGDNRLEWLQSNPAGETIWLMAFDESGEEVLGMISIMLRDLFIKGAKVKAGTLGDLMISDKCRVFGPALPLMKAAVAACKTNKIEILYTVPNPASMKLTERVGFSEKIILKHLVRPVKTKIYFEKKLKVPFLPSILSMFTDVMINSIPCLVRLLAGNNIQIQDQIGHAFDQFFTVNEDRLTGTGSVRSTEYLDWRFVSNPKYQFKIISMSDKNGICGYASFTIQKTRMFIYDFVYLSAKTRRTIISGLVCHAYKNNIQAVYLSVTSKSELPALLKKQLFMDAEANVSVMFHNDLNNDEIENWTMLEGDRNI